MLSQIQPVSTAPVLEHIKLSTSTLSLLARPDPLEAPLFVRQGGVIVSVCLRICNVYRDVHFYIPRPEYMSRRRRGEIPLLIACHGCTEHGLLFRASSTSYAYDELACKEGFIVAYPDGYKGNWNDGRIKAIFPATVENVDDVSFISHIIDYAQLNFGTSPDRTLMAGFANGGQLLLRLLYEENAPQLAGIGLHCAGLPEPSNNRIRTQPSPKSRVPVVMVNGTADPLTPYEGGTIVIARLPNGTVLGDRGPHVGALQAARHMACSWIQADEGEAESSQRGRKKSRPLRSKDNQRGRVIEKRGELSPIVVRDQWLVDGRPVIRLVSMIGEGHHVSVPGGSRMPGFLGPTLELVHAPQEVIEFFKVATHALSYD
ncbi:hypothetical protein FRB91_008059 [Serendipita sp. 411]|nr:hypothetical protein FRC16_002907 [Serendipita sp. 398]KAG8822246.1 hypothetical protein FRC19_006333 [Serendipita sp. 401]KAG8829546.1 hypothetical protein FRC18_009238 [Serendipita sp. 400]KAG8851353.1 hypothetical protein FRB91_008059 [Serendipita sp. 411]KAG9054354.1 hypothetical protein FS842_005378 [Serendipita sp. 407]